MKALMFLFSLELGFLPMGTIVQYEQPAFVQFDGSFYTDLGAAVFLYGFYIGGGVKTYMWKDQGELSFWPHMADYRVLSGFRWNIFEIGWRHYCIHPVVPMLALTRPQQIWEMAYDEVFVRISNERKTY